jgi:hypothetical protein
MQVMCPSAYCSIVCWFTQSFTTCFGLHDHLQVCRIFHIFKDPASLIFWFAALFLRGDTLHVSYLYFVPVLFSFVFFGVFFLIGLSACRQAEQQKQHRNKTQMKNMQSVTT